MVHLAGGRICGSGMTTAQLVTESEWKRAAVITGLLREADPLIDPLAAAHIDTPQEI